MTRGRVWCFMLDIAVTTTAVSYYYGTAGYYGPRGPWSIIIIHFGESEKKCGR